MTRFPLCALAVTILCHSAFAQGCQRSLDTILNGGIGPLPLAARSYQNLYKVCVRTLTMSNVRNAFVMRDGGIAVLPRRTGVMATAETLSEFCQMFPRNRLRFIVTHDLSDGMSVGSIVTMSSSSAPSCLHLLGHP